MCVHRAPTDDQEQLANIPAGRPGPSKRPSAHPSGIQNINIEIEIDFHLFEKGR